ncbi:MAG: M1 family metallopeptidase, partial [Bacteroidetes bacterium]|nr:M1 family metallopeptidase [Bacteroidota bacterium]
MKYFTLLFLVLSLSVNAAEIRTQADWQQRVDYTIQVSLDDVNHVLNGWVKMVYKNNSPHRLDSIYMHLWPNAYSSRTTDFAEQQLINGKTGFHYSEWSERGSIDSLNFTVAGKSATYYKLPGQPDIAVLKLNQPLDPGSIVEIETPFRVKIPGSFSRFGHVDQDYQITQWFPKPAVYDVNGWNPMPYLDQGEFYSEFGKFEVKITVPKNYLVAATGELQEESEWTFIRKRRDNPIDKFEGWASSSETKTLTYIQDNIHDFAWFASKYFNVQEDEVELEGGSKVGTFVFAPVKKINSTKDIASALQFYSKNCGTYPYRYCTVVQGPIKAGGGMEYPMITVVASLGEEVIVHEVGHNWFYGILGSNERRYPWMDESINTYFESQTMHAGSGMTADLDKPRFDATQANDQGMNLLARWMERQEMHQPIGLQSDLFTGLNYGVMVYGKGAMSFGHLHAYLGEETFYNCFRTYFNEWKFRHPLPNDMKTVFEAVSQDDLSWFFDGIITTEGHLDYKVVKTEGNAVIIQNSGMVEAPYPIGLFNKGEFVMEMWQPGHRGEVKVELPSGMEIDLVKIDPYGIMQESNVKNNTIRMTGMLKKVEPIRVGLY